MTSPFFNFLFIVPILISLLEKAEGRYGMISAGICGFFLDIFSENPIGLSILILFAISLLIKFVLKHYVQIPAIKLS
jgi:cell shape-determining protein MreD